MGIQLHLLNAAGTLDSYEQKIRESFTKSISEISKYLEVDNVDVVIQQTEFVIPETGMMGYAPTADKVFLSVDPTNKNLSEKFNIEFLATLGHELHHCMRHGGPGYGKTLKEAIVSEGLACHFETELRNGAVPFYACTLSKSECEQYFKQMESDLENEKYNHNAWFFGSKKLNIPKLCGYSVGYNLVDKFIVKNSVPASKLWSKSAIEILETV